VRALSGPIINVHNALKVNSRLLFLGMAFALLMGIAQEEQYKHFLHDGLVWKISPEKFVDDVLMVVFFTIVLLDSRRPLLPGGDLHGDRKWVLPVFVAVGGVVAPALIVFFGPWGSEVREAWAIPTATDIVLVLVAIRYVLGRFSVVREVVGLAAIIDDVIGVIIILVVFSGGISASLLWLLLPVGAFLFCKFMMNKKMEVDNYKYYLPFIIPSWIGFYMAGAHPALAGLPVVYAIRYDPATVHMAVETYHHLLREGKCRANALLDFEHVLRVPTEYVLFLFGATAAVINLASPEFQTVTIAVSFGLLIGKPVGMMAGCLVAEKFAKAKLPAGVDRKQMLIGTQLASIGMTVAFFVANQTYADEALRDAAKLGAFFAIGAVALAEIWRILLRVPRVTVEPVSAFGHHSHELEGLDVSEADFEEHDREYRDSPHALPIQIPARIFEPEEVASSGR